MKKEDTAIETEKLRHNNKGHIFFNLYLTKLEKLK